MLNYNPEHLRLIRAMHLKLGLQLVSMWCLHNGVCCDWLCENHAYGAEYYWSKFTMAKVFCFVIDCLSILLFAIWPFQLVTQNFTILFIFQ